MATQTLSWMTACPPARPGPSGFAQLIAAIGGTLEAWMERRRQRRALMGLSEAMLKDIGIDRAQAYAEAVKPFWRG